MHLLGPMRSDKKYGASAPMVTPTVTAVLLLIMLLHTVTGFNLATSASIYLPIILMLNYQLLNVPPTNAFGDVPFCENCVMLDPNEPARLVREVSFKTGCRGEICMSDLQLSARWLDIDSDVEYILGSTKKASLEFTVYNNGENAYLPQLNVTLLPARLTLANLTRECRQTVTIESVNVLCDLNRGLPLKASHTAKYTLELDMTKLKGGTVSKAEIRAEALSTSEELVPMDNFYETMLSLREYSEIEFVSPPPDKSHVSLKGKDVNKFKLTLHNNGPSVFRNVEVTMNVPFRKPNSGGQTNQFIDKNSIVFSASLGNKTLDYTWIQNGEDLLLHNHGLTASQKNRIDEFLSKLPSGRKLLLSCLDEIELYEQCERFTVAVEFFHPGNETIVIEFSFQVDLDAVANSLPVAPADIPGCCFVVFIMANVQQKRDPAESAKHSRFTLAPNDLYTLVYHYPDQHLTIPTPSNTATGTWVWSLVIIGSVLSSIILH
ncbi:integrin alpha-PS5-like [Anopheles darlingi]|uniref:integrin alpha-PS5-like n=1 Tax=Anopheles darlingi TaxID=43151 RepID=UPI0021002421|nr:integrin alpha-PS5-like [Anopheles darlingi]